MLAYADHMLRAARYVPVMSPALKTTIHGHAERFTYRFSPPNPSKPLSSSSPTPLCYCEDAADIARIAGTIFNEGEGILLAVDNFARTAAHNLAAFDAEEAGAIADQFLSIARQLDTSTSVYGFIGENLLDLHGDVSAAQPPAVPAPAVTITS
ncbi:hypothetical protein ACFVXQ_10690 [Kitasatospora sp. NPDC058263]